MATNSSRPRLFIDSWNTLAGPSKLVGDRRRQQAVGDLLDVRGRRAERDARAQAERDRHRRQLAGVVDRLRTDRLLEARRPTRAAPARRCGVLNAIFFSESACSWYFGSSSSSTRYCAVSAVDRRRPLRAERRRTARSGSVVAFRPTAAALSRSITRLMRGLFISMSVETSCTSGTSRVDRLLRAAAPTRTARRCSSACIIRL